jgi:hypothetical protein
MGKPVAIVFGVGAEQGLGAARSVNPPPSPQRSPARVEGKLNLVCLQRGLLKIEVRRSF